MLVLRFALFNWTPFFLEAGHIRLSYRASDTDPLAKIRNTRCPESQNPLVKGRRCRSLWQGKIQGSHTGDDASRNVSSRLEYRRSLIEFSDLSRLGGHALRVVARTVSEMIGNGPCISVCST
jgi:hypothetical protein